MGVINQLASQELLVSAWILYDRGTRDLISSSTSYFSIWQGTLKELVDKYEAGLLLYVVSELHCHVQRLMQTEGVCFNLQRP